MMFDNVRCRAPTRDHVNATSGLVLHQLERLDSPERIGAPPAALNQLVDYDPDRDDSPLLYFTAGGPYFETIRNCGFAVELRPERDAALKVKQHADTKISAASASTGATAPARAEQETG